MDLRNLKRVNDLWIKIYPYLAAQAMEYYGRSQGNVLELGPFSGGISVELARLHPGLTITIAAQDPGVVDYLQKEIEGAGHREHELFPCTSLMHLLLTPAPVNSIFMVGVSLRG